MTIFLIILCVYLVWCAIAFHQLHYDPKISHDNLFMDFFVYYPLIFIVMMLVLAVASLHDWKSK